ncbi:hypothetical protein AM571_PA00316 (plasmid) [Rhizobium etli 8C-3]|uniref:Uncharacterized protein n=1 Tax=Rhizobium etli 8C-3 TaxID=538025 RepID=A0A1L5PAH2_RHIET|nr:hypothetical protein [Rhizobium etli]APO77197.1 hypothetical protein AM571_PA00316 [Rhizobium etli 8C-3]
MQVPKGLTIADIFSERTIGEGLDAITAKSRPQYAAHRGVYEPALHPENTTGAFFIAFLLSALLAEPDVMQLSRQHGEATTFVLSHDETAERTIGLAKRWSELTPEEVIGRPIIVKEIVDGEFTDRFHLTDEWVGMRSPLGIHGTNWFHSCPTFSG